MQVFQHFATIFVPLLLIMDPPGNLIFFRLFTEKEDQQTRNRTAAVAAVTAGLILLFFGITGDSILRYFGISLPAFQLAGGFIFFLYALQMLQIIPVSIKASIEERREGVDKENVALVPLATPLMAGPGAITAVLAWRHGEEGWLHFTLLSVAILIACFACYLVFRAGDRILSFLGVGGIGVMTRLMGLLLAVIAMQFIVDGARQILRS